MTRTVVPETMDDRERFEMDGSKCEEGFSKGECGMDDKMEGYYRNPGFLMKPLKVMF